MAKLKLCGGCTYSNVLLKDQELTEAVEQELTNNILSGFNFDDSTILYADFSNEDTSGSNFDGSFGENVERIEVYKTLSEQGELYKVCDLAVGNPYIFEDFAIGSLCDYTYYIYPVNENGAVQYILKSNPYQLNDGIVRIIGLNQDEQIPTKYAVDYDNVWHLEFNATNNGFTSNMSKTFNDSLSRYPTEIIGSMNYRSMQLTGLIGRFDCGAKDYIDTYDDIIEWEKFMSSPQLKLVIDRRGVMTLGNFETNSFSYDETLAERHISITVDFRQTQDIANVEIVSGRQLQYNPNHSVLISAENKLLSAEYGDIRKLLAAQKGGM